MYNCLDTFAGVIANQLIFKMKSKLTYSNVSSKYNNYGTTFFTNPPFQPSSNKDNANPNPIRFPKNIFKSGHTLFEGVLVTHVLTIIILFFYPIRIEFNLGNQSGPASISYFKSTIFIFPTLINAR